jgi:RNA polymerase sigma-70 factor (ECF subfamily)
VDTDDLVQLTLIRALGHLEEFEPRRAGAFFAYLRRILTNQIRDEIRRAGRRPGYDELEVTLEDGRPSPLDQVIGFESLSRYEEALKRLPPEQQEAIILRLELGFTYPELAEALDRPTANAARLMASRAVLRLAREMHGRG